MIRISCCIAGCVALAACSNFRSEPDSTSSTHEALDVTKTGSLTRMQGTVANLQNESDRQNDTDSYYNLLKIGSDGVSGLSVKNGLNTLGKFKTTYGFDGSSNEKIARYYNRGDLGIGREMHCVDKSTSASGQVACYVKNFAAGDANTEFAFGLSANIAFTNLNANRYFATVGMVFRKNAAVSANKVFFVVYNDQDQLANAAALDRTGVQFAAAFTPGGANPAGHGTPGTNFNNHIPSNCVTCHGGQKYNFTNGQPNQTGIRNEIGSLFLPFDIDQFDFDSTHPRDENAFRSLNQIVRNVAVASGSTIDLNSSVRNQVDVWYNNPSHLATLSANFSAAVPTGWNSPDGSNLYVNVIRGSCRNCHMTNDQSTLHFDTEAQFNTPVVRAQTVAALCNYGMPHSLQSVRQFWQSSQPAALEAYLRSPTGGNSSSLADALRACGPGNVATLDPQLISASLSLL